jgi:hypothetical protein
MIQSGSAKATPIKTKISAYLFDLSATIIVPKGRNKCSGAKSKEKNLNAPNACCWMKERGGPSLKSKGKLSYHPRPKERISV